MTSNNISLDGVPPSLFLFAVDIFENMIHLFQGPAPGLWDEEKRPNQRQEAKDGEEGISPESGVLHQGWRDQTLLANIRAIGR